MTNAKDEAFPTDNSKVNAPVTSSIEECISGINSPKNWRITTVAFLDKDFYNKCKKAGMTPAQIVEAMKKAPHVSGYVWVSRDGLAKSQ